MESPSTLEVVLEHESLSVDVATLDAMLRHLADTEGDGAPYAITVVLTGREVVLDLNRAYLQHDFPTDVLSFRLDEEEDEVLEGEVYVDLDMATERHEEFGSDFTTEVYRYAIHGTLHLFGYDDHTEETKAQMRALEDRYLQLRPA